MTTTRRLAAILAADVAGYSRLMAADEVGTLEALKACRREVVDSAIAEHRGRIVKTTGDGMLVEFASAVDAVTCAMAVQEKMAARGGSLAFRIGINVGDIIIDGDDIFGDGVNVAARVENECQPGGVCLSAQAFDQVQHKTPFGFDDLGERPLKNIDRPIRLYSASSFFVATPNSMALEPSAHLPLPDKPSIAVLPFQNMSADPEQEYFADGIVEEIITALSRFRQLFVIARNSSFVFKGKTLDIKRIGRELGVRYVLEGSVRKSGGRVRITGQLIDATTGAHQWADQFDGTLDDVFSLQEEVAKSVVAAIVFRIDQVDTERARRKPTESLSAYECFLQAQALYGQLKSDEALPLLYKAIELDDRFAGAYGLAAMCIDARAQQGTMTDIVKETRELERIARRAVELGQEDAFALAHGAFVLARVFGELDDARAYVDRALVLNPNCATGWAVSGGLRIVFGQPDAAIDHLARAMRLSPLDPLRRHRQHMTGLAHMFAGRYDEAASWVAKALHGNVPLLLALRTLAASLALAGRLDEARKVLGRMLEIDPTRRISNLEEVITPYFRPRDFAKYVEGLRLAGLPE